MANKLKKVFLSIISLWLLIITSNTFAKVSSFDVELSPKTVSVWQTVDITIKALDENGNIDKNYTWKIVIVEWDNTSPDEISFPWFEDPDFASYQFKEEDQGVKKFENAISFKKPWKKWVSVWEEDLNDNWPYGWDTVTVIWWASQGWEISITSPQDNETISKNSIKIIWKTLKNHSIKIKLNDKEEFNSISNSNWTFEQEINWLPDWVSTIQAFLLDWDWKEIGSSNVVKIEVQTNWPAFRWIEITPGWEVAPWTEMKAIVYAEPELNAVNLIIDDVVFSLDEKMEWKYEAIFSAPNKPWEYPVDLKLKDDLWNTNNKPAIKIIKVVWETKTETPKKEKPKKEEQKQEEPKKETNTKCEDSTISGLKLTKLKTKSILSWDEIKDAKWYTLYKKDENWEYQFVEKLDTNKAVIPIVWQEIKYDYFKVRAICEKEWKEMEAKEYSKATKIQTGPVEIILVFLAMILSWTFFFFKRKNV